MLSSDIPEVRKAGARQACLSFLQDCEAKPLAEACISGSEEQRLGAAQVFSANLHTHRKSCENNLILLFNDSSEEVKSEAAGCFKNFKNNELGEFVSLIEAFMNSPTFKIWKSELIYALDETTAEIPEITYRVCEQCINSMNSGENEGDLSALSEISSLILRLYGQKNINDTLRIKCLDLIDRIMQTESNELNRELSKGLSLYDR